jgi:hypothetical protein
MRNSERDVFNNLFIQTGKVPGVVVVGKQATCAKAAMSCGA